jgi:xanthine/uracil permease
VITPPIIISGQGGANLGGELPQYLVSTSLIVCGILSSIQITRFHIWKTPYYIGTGLISVVGTSFAIIPVATGAFAQMYKTRYCPVDADGNHLPCPKGYGAILGTACLCALLEIGMSFTSPKYLKKLVSFKSSSSFPSGVCTLDPPGLPSVACLGTLTY